MNKVIHQDWVMYTLHSNDNVYTPEGDPSIDMAYDGGNNALNFD